MTHPILLLLLIHLVAWHFVVYFVLSWSYWWQTDLPAELTNLAARSPRLRKWLGLEGRLPDKPFLDRGAWFTWLNSTYAYGSLRRSKFAQLLSCPRCMSLHLGYTGALLVWGSFNFLAQLQVHWLFVPLAMLSAPGRALALMNPPR